MNDNERGMVKYAPYQSLVEQGTYLRRMRAEKQRVEKKILFPDEAEEINEILMEYQGGDIELSWWKNGKIYTYCGKILKIDPQNKTLHLADGIVELSSLQSLRKR